jgi:hypothetical protein
MATNGQDNSSMGAPELLDRRSFLKVGAISAALPLASSAKESGGQAPAAGKRSPDERELLPSVPTLRDLASDRLVHHFRDLFNPPEAYNEWGRLKAAKSVSGIYAISFPPYACCGVPEMPFSPGHLLTCELFLNDRILNHWLGATGPVTYRWCPQRGTGGFVFRAEARWQCGRFRPLPYCRYQPPGLGET